MSGQMIRMMMRDGAEIAVYHAKPAGARKGGLVLLQEIFGVTAHIRDVCEQYATDGYEVLAPSLFDREVPGFDVDNTVPDFQNTPEFQQARKLAREVHPFAQSVADTQTCIDRLKPLGQVFVVGYCYGGSVAWAIAAQSDDLAAASSYYGGLVPGALIDRVPKCPTIAHFGRFDPAIPFEGVEAVIARKHPTAQIFVYEAGHGFNSNVPKHYHKDSADLARQRTLALFHARGG